MPIQRSLFLLFAILSLTACKKEKKKNSKLPILKIQPKFSMRRDSPSCIMKDTNYWKCIVHGTILKENTHMPWLKIRAKFPKI